MEAESGQGDRRRPGGGRKRRRCGAASPSWRRANRALEQELRPFIVLADNIPDNIYFKDREGRFLWVNRNMYQSRGHDSRAGLIGKTSADIHDPERARDAMEDDRRIVETGEYLLNKLETDRDRAGRPTWVLTNKIPLRDARGDDHRHLRHLQGRHRPGERRADPGAGERPAQRPAREPPGRGVLQGRQEPLHLGQPGRARHPGGARQGRRDRQDRRRLLLRGPCPGRPRGRGPDHGDRHPHGQQAGDRQLPGRQAALGDHHQDRAPRRQGRDGGHLRGDQGHHRPQEGRGGPGARERADERPDGQRPGHRLFQGQGQPLHLDQPRHGEPPRRALQGERGRASRTRTSSARSTPARPARTSCA